MTTTKSHTGFGITAPRFTPEDEQRERDNLTESEKRELETRLYGDPVHGDGCDFFKKENGDVASISALIHEMNEALERIPLDQKESLTHAMDLCPDQITDSEKTRFLRRVDYNPKLAAKRYTRYWEKRLSIFGEDYCYLPFTLDGAFQRDAETLKRGLFFVLGKDASGRGVYYHDPSRHDWDKYDLYSLIRASWYFLDLAGRLSNDGQSIVGMIYQKHEVLSDFSKKFVLQNLELEMDCLPIRCNAVHLCHPNFVFGEIIAPVLKFILGKRFRLMFQVHRGLLQEVVAQLESFGIHKNIVPYDFGGNQRLDVVSWLEKRRTLDL